MAAAEEKGQKQIRTERCNIEVDAQRKGVREMMLAEMMGNFDRLTDDNDWGGMADVMREMMWPYRSGGGRVFWQFHWILELVTWGLVIALMIAAFRWLWRKGDETSKRK